MMDSRRINNDHRTTAFSSALHTDREDPEVEVHLCQFQFQLGSVIGTFR